VFFFWSDVALAGLTELFMLAVCGLVEFFTSGDITICSVLEFFVSGDLALSDVIVPFFSGDLTLNDLDIKQYFFLQSSWFFVSFIMLHTLHITFDILGMTFPGSSMDPFVPTPETYF
jgi:hypothetical protein